MLVENDGPAVLFCHAEHQLFAVDAHGSGSFDADPDPPPVHSQHDNPDATVYEDCFSTAPGQDQHGALHHSQDILHHFIRDRHQPRGSSICLLRDDDIDHLLIDRDAADAGTLFLQVRHE